MLLNPFRYHRCGQDGWGEKNDIVTVFGAQNTAESIKELLNSDAKFVPFTRGLSFCVIDKKMLSERYFNDTVTKMASAVCMHDTRAFFRLR